MTARADGYHNRAFIAVGTLGGVGGGRITEAFSGALKLTEPINDGSRYMLA